MKVKITQSVSGADRHYAPGDVVDMADGQAESWIEHGMAEASETTAKKSRARRGTDTPPETR